jgi:hypothetical protein
MDAEALLARIDAALAAGHVLPPALDYAAVPPARLHDELPQLWVDAYHDATAGDPEIVQFTDGANHYLFDLVAERVVAAWGDSRAAEAARDRSRQAGFIPRFSRHYEGKDRGHFLSHGQGGLMDVNFFPQAKEVNRGWSAAGKLYRAMENHAATHPGTFSFSRPLYARDNDTWDPEQLEYGVRVGGVELRVVVFPNRSVDDEP